MELDPKTKKYLLWGGGGLLAIVGAIYLMGRNALNAQAPTESSGGGSMMPLFIGGGASIPMQAPAAIPQLGGELWTNPAANDVNTDLEIAKLNAGVQEAAIKSNEAIQMKAIDVVNNQATTQSGNVSSTATATRLDTQTAAQGVIDIVKAYGGLTDAAALRIYDEAKVRGMNTSEVAQALNRASAQTNYGRTFTAGEVNAFTSRMGLPSLG